MRQQLSARFQPLMGRDKLKFLMRDDRNELDIHTLWLPHPLA